MKNKFKLLKILGFIVLLAFLVGFSQNRYKMATLKGNDVKIDFSQSNHFVTKKHVEKVLAFDYPEYPNIPLHKLETRKVEERLKENNYIADANVYLDNEGILHTKISQEIPILRIHDTKDYYLTTEGETIPLSQDFSARVLLAGGKINPKDYKGLVALSKLINGDNFLKNRINGIQKIGSDSYNLVLNDAGYILELGSLNNLERKLLNFKVFHKEFIEKVDSVPFQKISLRFNNQIVATK